MHNRSRPLNLPKVQMTAQHQKLHSNAQWNELIRTLNKDPGQV